MFSNYLKNEIKPPRRQQRQVFLDETFVFYGALAVKE